MELFTRQLYSSKLILQELKCRKNYRIDIEIKKINPAEPEFKEVNYSTVLQFQDGTVN